VLSLPDRHPGAYFCIPKYSCTHLNASGISSDENLEKNWCN